MLCLGAVDRWPQQRLRAHTVVVGSAETETLRLMQCREVEETAAAMARAALSLYMRQKGKLKRLLLQGCTQCWSCR